MIHNAGGRDIDAVINDIAFTGYAARTMIPGGPPFEVAVVHHAGCGTRFLAGAAFRSAFAACNRPGHGSARRRRGSPACRSPSVPM